MPVSYRIIPHLGLIYVRYWGFAASVETLDTIQAIAGDPDFRHEYRHLADFSQVQDFEADYAAIMLMQAKAAEAFLSPRHLPAIVYYAPNPTSLRMARIALRSWEGVTPITAVVLSERSQVFEVLGISDPPLDLLLTPAT